jgi:hypothetical protein
MFVKMGMLPGWDSISSAEAWSRFWFWFGIACAVAVIASQVISRIYDSRKDELVAAAGQQRKQEADAAEARRVAEAEQFQQNLSEANARAAAANERAAALEQGAAQLRQAVTWPTISSELGQNLIARLAAVPTSVPRNIIVAWLANDPQTQLLAAQFVGILRRAGWVVVASQARTYTSPALLFGIFLEGPQSEAVQALRDAFSAAGISFRTDAVGGSFTATGSGSMFGNPPPPTLLVGSKGPPF